MQQLIIPNIHRFKEGARVLEDLARFVLNDQKLFHQVKSIKQQVVYPGIPFEIDHSSYPEKQRSKNLLELIHANALRMQEAARVLEEVYDKELFKQIRFATYDVHKKVADKAQNYINLEKLQGIYPIYDPREHEIEHLVKIVQENPTRIIQLRMKSANKSEIIAAAILLKKHLPDILLIINDHLDLALAYADGVHLGLDDLPIDVARRLSPSHFIIGATCKTVVEAEQAAQAGANYLGVGCLFSSDTKPDAKRVSLEMLKQIKSVARIPVCAIGGINESTMNQITAIGVEMIAMGKGLMR